jgi:hypothetical protein
MKKLRSDIKKISFGLIFLILMLAIMLQTPSVSASTITRSFGPPYYKRYYAADLVELNYANCWYSDTNIYGAEVHFGENWLLRWVHLGVAKDFTTSYSTQVRVMADFRIEGYLWAESRVGLAHLRIGINLEKRKRDWLGNYYWSYVAYWDAAEYYLEYGESMIFEGDTIHFTGPYFSMSSGTYRLIFNVYGESLFGFFCESSSQLYEPGKIYFDSIGYQYEGGGGGGGGCPILSVFNGNEYVEEGLLDIHNPDGIDEIYEHILTTQPQAIDNRYYLSLTEHEKTISHIDKVELWGESVNGQMIKLPLLSAIHNELGQVRYELLLSDDVDSITKGADHNNGVSQFIDLQFLAPPGLQFTQFLFVIEGNNMHIK